MIEMSAWKRGSNDYQKEVLISNKEMYKQSRDSKNE